MKPEIIEQARQMKRTGLFQRKITSRVPDDLNTDRLTLACGHQTFGMSWENAEFSECRQCAEEWMQQQEGK